MYIVIRLVLQRNRMIEPDRHIVEEMCNVWSITYFTLKQ